MSEDFLQTWESVQGSIVTPDGATLLRLTLYLIVAGLLSLYLRWVYRCCGASASDAESITRIFPLLTIVTTGVIIVVKSSLALSLGLVGALSIVRFRAAIKEPEELVYLFLCIAVGLSLGADQPIFALLLVSVASLFAFGIHKFSGGDQQRVMLTVTGDADIHFAADSNAFQRVRDAVGSCTIHRLEIENGRGQLRVLLPRHDAAGFDAIIARIRKDLPDCELSFVNMDSIL
jgi:hypothetical protein